MGGARGAGGGVDGGLLLGLPPMDSAQLRCGGESSAGGVQAASISNRD